MLPFALVATFRVLVVPRSEVLDDTRTWEPRRDLRKVFSEVFQGSAQYEVQYEVWTDSEPLVEEAASRHLEVVLLTEIFKGRLPAERCVLIPANPEGYPLAGKPAPPGFYLKWFGRSACLVVPLRSFATDRKGIDYLLDSLSSVDFPRAVLGVRACLAQLACRVEPLTITSPRGTQLTVELGENLHFVTPKASVPIAPGEWVSLAQYLEVGIIPLAAKSSFSVSGVLVAEGIAVAHHVIHPQIALPAARLAWNFIASKMDRRENRLEIVMSDGHCESISINGSGDISEEILGFTDPSVRGALLELAFSTINLEASPDWRRNSQVNEAWGGVHVAYGAGLHGAHIDFIDTTARVS